MAKGDRKLCGPQIAVLGKQPEAFLNGIFFVSGVRIPCILSGQQSIDSNVPQELISCTLRRIPLGFITAASSQQEIFRFILWNQDSHRVFRSGSPRVCSLLAICFMLMSSSSSMRQSRNASRSFCIV